MPGQRGRPGRRAGANTKGAAFEGLIEEVRTRRAAAIVGIDLDDEALGESMFMVGANGAARDAWRDGARADPP